ncbi:9645_t:CDS:1, partial [Funneliformis geosporum]
MQKIPKLASLTLSKIKTEDNPQNEIQPIDINEDIVKQEQETEE